MAIDAALLDDVISDKVVTTLENRLAGLRSMSMDFSDEVANKKTTKVEVPLSSGGSVSENPTDFETSPGMNLGKATVDMVHLFLPWSLNFAQYNTSNLARLENNLVDNANAFADAIWQKIAALFTVANYGAAAVDVTSDNFGAAQAKTLWQGIAKAQAKHLLLDSAYYAALMPATKDGFYVDGRDMAPYGFTGIHHVSDWSTAGTNVVGAAINPAAVAVASRLPEIPQKVADQITNIRTLPLDQLGMTVMMCEWGTTKTREDYMTIEAYFGAAKGRAEACALLENGAS